MTILTITQYLYQVNVNKNQKPNIMKIKRKDLS